MNHAVHCSTGVDHAEHCRTYGYSFGVLGHSVPDVIHVRLVHIIDRPCSQVTHVASDRSRSCALTVDMACTLGPCAAAMQGRCVVYPGCMVGMNSAQVWDRSIWYGSER